MLTRYIFRVSFFLISQRIWKYADTLYIPSKIFYKEIYKKAYFFLLFYTKFFKCLLFLKKKCLQNLPLPLLPLLTLLLLPLLILPLLPLLILPLLPLLILPLLPLLVLPRLPLLVLLRLPLLVLPQNGRRSKLAHLSTCASDEIR